MRELFKANKDTLITFVLILILTIINSSIKFNDSVVEVLVNFIPMVVIIFFVALNKAKMLGKFSILFNRRKNIGIKYTSLIKNIYFEGDQYKSFIEAFVNLFSEYTDKKIVYQNIGEYINKSVINISYINLELTYNHNDGELLLKTVNSAKFKFIYKLIRQIDVRLKEAIAKVGKGYTSSKASLEIEFFSDKGDNITNPIVNKIFEGFNVRTFSLNYEADNGSLVTYGNRVISFINSNSENMIKDIKNELMLW